VPPRFRRNWLSNRALKHWLIRTFVDLLSGNWHALCIGVNCVGTARPATEPALLQGGLFFRPIPIHTICLKETAIRTLWRLIAATVVLIGVAGADVMTDYDHTANFSNYKTYSGDT